MFQIYLALLCRRASSLKGIFEPLPTLSRAAFDSKMMDHLEEEDGRRLAGQSPWHWRIGHWGEKNYSSQHLAAPQEEVLRRGLFEQCATNKRPQDHSTRMACADGSHVTASHDECVHRLHLWHVRARTLGPQDWQHDRQRVCQDLQFAMTKLSQQLRCRRDHLALLAAKSLASGHQATSTPCHPWVWVVAGILVGWVHLNASPHTGSSRPRGVLLRFRVWPNQVSLEEVHGPELCLMLACCCLFGKFLNY